jgi:Flp pilus assembly CpaF family ATPase
VIMRQIGLAVELVVQMERLPDGTRRITGLTALESQADGAIHFADVFVWIGGRHRATGVVPHFHPRLAGLPADLYAS